MQLNEKEAHALITATLFSFVLHCCHYSFSQLFGRHIANVGLDNGCRHYAKIKLADDDPQHG
jgi:hypothetical protein